MTEPTPLPEGMDASDVRSYAVSMSIVANLLNLTGVYVTAESGSDAESDAESALEDYVEQVLSLGAEVAGKALLVFASVITQTAEESAVQAWFDDQSAKVAPYLTPEERGE